MGRREYFCGWYFKCRAEHGSVALIPAVHVHRGRKSASLQIITGDGSIALPVDARTARVKRRVPHAVLGGSTFAPGGIFLNMCSGNVLVRGSLTFHSHAPLRYDVMGPFACVPGLQCRHSVFSMKSTVSGWLQVADARYRFRGGDAYIEGDRGRSFPKRYLWTQCSFPDGSLMLAVADIPLMGRCFTGVTGAVLLGGREYRVATYLGARAEVHPGGAVTVRQGALTLTAELLTAHPHQLNAPLGGAMTRTIRENLVCRARYRLQRSGQCLLELDSEHASFEFEYPIV